MLSIFEQFTWTISDGKITDLDYAYHLIRMLLSWCLCLSVRDAHGMLSVSHGLHHLVLLKKMILISQLV